MTAIAKQLDPIMEMASQSLAKTDYFACEAACLRALSIARRNRDWPYYARILMPLLESRRQRRMIARDGTVRIGSAQLESEPATWIRQFSAAGCLVITRPHDDEVAKRFAKLVREECLSIEVLLVINENPVSDSEWTLSSMTTPKVTCAFPVPQPGWTERWMNSVEAAAATSKTGSASPVDWFLDGCEALGDAALASVEAPLGDPQRVIDLEQCLGVVTDHEKIHQALSDAALALRSKG